MKTRETLLSLICCLGAVQAHAFSFHKMESGQRYFDGHLIITKPEPVNVNATKANFYMKFTQCQSIDKLNITPENILELKLEGDHKSHAIQLKTANERNSINYDLNLDMTVDKRDYTLYNNELIIKGINSSNVSAEDIKIATLDEGSVLEKIKENCKGNDTAQFSISTALDTSEPIQISKSLVIPGLPPQDLKEKLQNSEGTDLKLTDLREEFQKEFLCKNIAGMTGTSTVGTMPIYERESLWINNNVRSARTDSKRIVQCMTDITYDIGIQANRAATNFLAPRLAFAVSVAVTNSITNAVGFTNLPTDAASVRKRVSELSDKWKEFTQDPRRFYSEIYRYTFNLPNTLVDELSPSNLQRKTKR